MPSQKQIDANRRNAQKSTGPRTPEGRAAVSRNALTHGLTAANIVLDAEDEAAFEELLQASLAEFDPQTPTEQILVEQLVSAAWRLRRVRLIEQGIFDDRLFETAESIEQTYKKPSVSMRLGHVFRRDACGPEVLAALSRFEGRIERSYYRALRELRACRELRDRRAQAGKNDLEKQSQFDPPANSSGTPPDAAHASLGRPRAAKGPALDSPVCSSPVCEASICEPPVCESTPFFSPPAFPPPGD